MKVVAVTEHIERAGTILMWTLSGPTDGEALRDQWVAAGLDPGRLPPPPTPATALRRAVGALREKSRIVHAIGKGNGFVVVDVTATASAVDDPTFAVQARASLDLVGRLVLKGGTDEVRQQITEAFATHENALSTEDVSAWLTKVVVGLDGVALRGGGGVYFIPQTRLSELDTMIAALKAVSDHAIYRIPAMAGDDAVQAILDAVEAEAVAEAAAIEAALAEEKYGSGGLQNRIGRTDKVEEKVSRYEELLGAKLETLRERLATLRADLTVAMIKAQQAEAAEREAG